VKQKRLDRQHDYHSIEWSSIAGTLEGLGFPATFIYMIKTCITTSIYFSVLINGSPEDWIKGKRCLRQGEPLSPYLFVLDMEMHSRMCRLAIQKGLVCHI